jgi:hypothetical protein
MKYTKKFFLDIFTANLMRCTPFETDSKTELNQIAKQYKSNGYRVTKFERTEAGLIKI